MKSLSTVLLIFLMPTILFSQNLNWEISGQITDSQNFPIQFANIFINNSRIGTVSDKDGKFVLKIPSQITHTILIASFVGYNSAKISIAKSQKDLQKLTIKLTAGIELKEVTITAKHDREWRKKWRIFRDGLLGNSDFIGSCQILNMDKVRLVYDDEKKRVIATSQEPIIIKNNALGLKVTFQMEKFESDGVITYFSGNKHFENLIPTNKAQEEKWQRNKVLAYDNSFRNFLVSLTQRKVKQSGFEVLKLISPPSYYLGKTTIENEIFQKHIVACKEEEICFYDEESDQYILKSDYPLIVFTTKQYNHYGAFKDYPFPSSTIYLTNHLAVFTQNGWLSRPNGILIKEYWGNEGLSSMLPDDFFPEGIIADSTNIQPIAKVEALNFKKMVLDNQQLNKNFQFQSIVYDKLPIQNSQDKSSTIIADFKLNISEKDYNLTVFDLLRQIPGLSVTNTNDSNGNYKINFLGTNSNLTNSKGISLTPVLILDGLVFNDEESTINVLKSINVSEIQEIGANKFGGNAILGARGGNGSIIINLKK